MQEIYEIFEISFLDFNIQYISSLKYYNQEIEGRSSITFHYFDEKDYLYNLI